MLADPAGARTHLRLGCLRLPGPGTPDLLPELPEGSLTGTFVVGADGNVVVAERVVLRGDRISWGLVIAERVPGIGGWRWRDLADDGHDHRAPVLSPDGTRLAYQRIRPGCRGAPPDTTLRLADIDGTATRELAADLDGWPTPEAWAPAGDRLYVTVDQDGSRPVYEVDVASGRARRLTGVGHHAHVQTVEGALYAVRSAIDAPPEPVGFDPEPAFVATALPGRLERVSTDAGTGPAVRGWLCLPPADMTPKSGAPLLVWLHGGPYASWSAWSWRWNPWLAVARGYAVLLPDPTPSVGYGRAFLARAWRDWSGAPYADLCRIVDRTCARDDVDATRTAVLGSSFGGYLVNVAITRSGRFRAAVSHAGIWDLRAFVSGTAVPRAFVAEFGHPFEDTATGYDEHNPRRHARSITTPLLLSHGARDTTVPLTETMTAWHDLQHLGKPVTLLHLPDEGHEITRPGNVQLWYRCVFAFLDHTLRGEPWRPPPLL